MSRRFEEVSIGDAHLLKLLASFSNMWSTASRLASHSAKRSAIRASPSHTSARRTSQRSVGCRGL